MCIRDRYLTGAKEQQGENIIIMDTESIQRDSTPVCSVKMPYAAAREFLRSVPSSGKCLLEAVEKARDDEQDRIAARIEAALAKAMAASGPDAESNASSSRQAIMKGSVAAIVQNTEVKTAQHKAMPAMKTSKSPAVDP